MHSISPKTFGSIARVGAPLSDRKPDLPILLVRMSELYPRHSVITVDEADFRVYRKNKRETIPLICPPRRIEVRLSDRPKNCIKFPFTYVALRYQGPSHLRAIYTLFRK